MTKKKRVFISYSYKDKEKVHILTNKLLEEGIDIYQDQLNFADDTFTLQQNIQYKIESSEIILVILSSNFLVSSWTNYELKSFLEESYKRKITVIPVQIEKIKIPIELLDYEIINLYNNFESGLNKIIKKLQVIPEINFDKLSAVDFENLVVDLLRQYGFKNIQNEKMSGSIGIDIRAKYQRKSPFGNIINENWIVEVKFYKEERFTIKSIQNLIIYKSQLLPADLKLLLVTNSLLSSVVLQYLNDYQKIENTQIEVIDGLLLKQLISKRKPLLDKYFSK